MGTSTYSRMKQSESDRKKFVPTVEILVSPSEWSGRNGCWSRHPEGRKNRERIKAVIAYVKTHLHKGQYKWVEGYYNDGPDEYTYDESIIVPAFHAVAITHAITHVM